MLQYTKHCEELNSSSQYWVKIIQTSIAFPEQFNLLFIFYYFIFCLIKYTYVYDSFNFNFIIIN